MDCAGQAEGDRLKLAPPAREGGEGGRPNSPSPAPSPHPRAIGKPGSRGQRQPTQWVQGCCAGASEAVQGQLVGLPQWSAGATLLGAPWLPAPAPWHPGGPTRPPLLAWLHPSSPRVVPLVLAAPECPAVTTGLQAKGPWPSAVAKIPELRAFPLGGGGGSAITPGHLPPTR